MSDLRAGASPEKQERRAAVTVSVHTDMIARARGAWRWAYLNHVVDDPTFTDWINAAIARNGGTGEARSDSEQKPVPRMYWIDHENVSRLSDTSRSRSEAFRAAVEAELDGLTRLAQERGEQIEPWTKRLPNKLYRSAKPQ